MLWALNQVTTPALGFDAFLDLAADLGCAGVECRNDLGRPLFDGIAPTRAGAMIRARGLRLMGLSQVYPFNEGTAERLGSIRALAEMAVESGAGSLSLIPRNDGSDLTDPARRDRLFGTLERALPLLDATGMVALVEPLGFARSSLRLKSELVAMIDRLGAQTRLKLVHDVFHHALAGEETLFPQATGMVHVSGVIDPDLAPDAFEDRHRVPVDARDRLGAVAQLAALTSAGYAGPVSIECFAPEVQSTPDPAPALRQSMAFITAQLAISGARGARRT